VAAHPDAGALPRRAGPGDLPAGRARPRGGAERGTGPRSRRAGPGGGAGDAGRSQGDGVGLFAPAAGAGAGAGAGTRRWAFRGRAASMKPASRLTVVGSPAFTCTPLEAREAVTGTRELPWGSEGTRKVPSSPVTGW